MVNVTQIYWQLASRISKPLWHTPLLCVQWKTADDGQRNCSKHVEFYSKIKFEKLVHLVGFVIRIYVYGLCLFERSVPNCDRFNKYCILKDLHCLKKKNPLLLLENTRKNLHTGLNSLYQYGNRSQQVLCCSKNIIYLLLAKLQQQYHLKCGNRNYRTYHTTPSLTVPL